MEKYKYSWNTRLPHKFKKSQRSSLHLVIFENYRYKEKKRYFVNRINEIYSRLYLEKIQRNFLTLILH